MGFRKRINWICLRWANLAFWFIRFAWFTDIGDILSYELDKSQGWFDLICDSPDLFCKLVIRSAFCRANRTNWDKYYKHTNIYLPESGESDKYIFIIFARFAQQIDNWFTWFAWFAIWLIRFAWFAWFNFPNLLSFVWFALQIFSIRPSLNFATDQIGFKLKLKQVCFVTLIAYIWRLPTSAKSVVDYT